MSVLICGGAGYIGSHVNKCLSEAGYKTVVFDNLIYGHKEAVKWGEFVEGDLSNLSDLESVFSNYEINAVVHLAAYAYVGESVDEPEKYYYNNIVNTLNLLKVMRKHNCGKIIFSSSCTTFGEPDVCPITEDTPQNPVNPYGFTKLAVERIFKDYETAYGLKYIVLRYFNAAGCDPEGEIGENHNPETHIIPLVLDAALGIKPCIKVFGNDYPTPDGSCVRDYIHVTDLAQAHLLSLKHLESGNPSECFNLGNENGVSVFEIIDAVKRVIGADFKVTIAPRRKGDPAILVGSSEKIKSVLGWKALYPEIDTIVRHAYDFRKKLYGLK